MTGCMLLRGKYYFRFAEAWKQFKVTATVQDAANEDPNNLPQDQLYLILVSENGGRPLEHVQMYTFEAAKSIILQVRY